jgi:hypothetical protein
VLYPTALMASIVATMRVPSVNEKGDAKKVLIGTVQDKLDNILASVPSQKVV